MTEIEASMSSTIPPKVPTPECSDASVTSDVTRLLVAWRGGDSRALNDLMPLVEGELRKTARRHMRHERSDHTLQPTALVSELYLRLVDRRHVNWKNRAHFFGCAAQMMRQILVDHARISQAAKRQNGIKPLALDEAWDAATMPNHEMIELDAALSKLAKLDDRQSQVVVLHFFGGLTYREIGEVLGISAVTVKRDWQTARLWLLEQVRPHQS